MSMVCLGQEKQKQLQSGFQIYCVRIIEIESQYFVVHISVRINRHNGNLHNRWLKVLTITSQRVCPVTIWRGVLVVIRLSAAYRKSYGKWCSLLTKHSICERLSFTIFVPSRIFLPQDLSA